jgi:hypothetical protein
MLFYSLLPLDREAKRCNKIQYINQLHPYSFFGKNGFLFMRATAAIAPNRKL